LRTNRLTSVFKRNKVNRIRKNKVKRSLLVNLKINFYNKVKMAPEKYLDVGHKFDIQDNDEKLQVYFNDKCEQSVENFLKENDLQKGEYICFAPGAAHYTKMWPLENVDNLIKKTRSTFKCKIVVLGGPKEREILPQFESDKNVIKFSGKTSLLESAGILKYSKGIVTNDSGLMHMAVAVKIPVIALFGSTVKELGFFPYRANASVLEINDLWCRPCTHIGREKCPLGHFNCMRQISTGQVLKEMESKFN